MKNEEFASARKRLLKRWCKGLLGLLLFTVLSSAGANSSFFILHSSFPSLPSFPADTIRITRWRVQPTAPVEVADLDSSALDLRMPENVKQQVEYNDSLNLYYIGSKLGSGYLNAPIVMTPEEYMRWSERRARQQFFRVKDAENVKQKGEDKF